MQTHCVKPVRWVRGQKIKGAETLLVIIVRRHQNRSTLKTSNRSLEEWGQLLGDVPAATPILDRFLQQAEIIQITGRSYGLPHHPAISGTQPENTAALRPERRYEAFALGHGLRSHP